jgi:hypothetical protein
VSPPKLYHAAYDPPADRVTIAERIEADKAGRVMQMVQQEEPPF